MKFNQIAASVDDSADCEDENILYLVGKMHRALSYIAYAAYGIQFTAPEDVDDNGEADIKFWLEGLARSASAFLRKVGVTNPAGAYIAEYERAARKHPGMTLDSDKHTNESRFYALAEEVGEVCAALTYDNAATTGHNADLISEITQAGGLAIAWLTRYGDGEER